MTVILVMHCISCTWSCIDEFVGCCKCGRRHTQCETTRCIRRSRSATNHVISGFHLWQSRTAYSSGLQGTNSASLWKTENIGIFFCVVSNWIYTLLLLNFAVPYFQFQWFLHMRAVMENQFCISFQVNATPFCAKSVFITFHIARFCCCLASCVDNSSGKWNMHGINLNKCLFLKITGKHY